MKGRSDPIICSGQDITIFLGVGGCPLIAGPVHGVVSCISGACRWRKKEKCLTLTLWGIECSFPCDFALADCVK